MARILTLTRAAACILLLNVAAPAAADRSRSPGNLESAESPSSVAQQWPLPRRPAGLGLRALWSLGPERLAAIAEFPFDIMFAQQGLIVYDQAYPRLVVLDGATSRVRFMVGRRGAGPGEFTGRPVALSGRPDAPFTVEFATGRVLALENKTLRKVDVEAKLWTGAGCAYGNRGLLLPMPSREVLKSDNKGVLRQNPNASATADLWIVTLGAQSKIVDSVAYPWRDAISPWPLVRQVTLRQVDHDACLILPLYLNELAIVRSGAPPIVGRHIEVIPPAQPTIQRDGKAQRIGLAPGSRRGGIGGAVWRDKILVLFDGRTVNRARIIDVYDRKALQYQGSMLLPIVAQDITVSGDTLAVLGEVDDEPVLHTFLLSAPNANTPPRRAPQH